MAQRITQKTLSDGLAEVAKTVGIPHGHYKTDEEGNLVANPGAWELNHNSNYGGYRIEQIDADGKTIRVLTDRMSGQQMDAFLNGFAKATEVIQAKVTDTPPKK